MSFEVNHSQAGSGGIIPEGEYEVIIKSALEDATQGGTMYINVPLVIRNDIEQPYKNAYIWHKIWQLKQPKPADLACGGYSSWGIQNISKAAGLENGKKYDDLGDWGDDLKGKLIRVTVKHDQYNGNTQVNVKYVNETKAPDCKHEYKNQESTQATQQEQNPVGDFYPIDAEDDLPF